METSRDDLAMDWLTVSRQLASAAKTICNCLAALSSKRLTLEEKLIGKYLHSVIAECGKALTAIHWRLAKEQDLPQPALEELRKETELLNGDARELEKIIDYDLNFLEQYFEHDFYTRLANERRYLEKLRDLNLQLESA